MSGIAKRVAALEKDRSAVRLRGMTDAQLDAHIRGLGPGHPDALDAVLTKVLRHGSAWPIACMDPEHVEDQRSAHGLD